MRSADLVILCLLRNALKAKKKVWKDRRLIKELCINQKGAMNITAGITEWFDVETSGVGGQGSPFSSALFNMYTENMIFYMRRER